MSQPSQKECSQKVAHSIFLIKTSNMSLRQNYAFKANRSFWISHEWLGLSGCLCRRGFYTSKK